MADAHGTPGKRGDVDAYTKTFGNIPLNVQRRVLRFVNAARIPEDFQRLPQRIRQTGDEHELMHEPRGEAHEHDDHDDADHPPHAGDHSHPGTHAAPRARIELERKVAIEIIRRRPPLGYLHVREIFEIDPRIIGSWLEALIELLGALFYGSWSEPLLITVGATTYSIMNAAMLRSGKVLLIPSSTDTVLWNPSTSAFSVRNGATTGLTADLSVPAIRSWATALCSSSAAAAAPSANPARSKDGSLIPIRPRDLVEDHGRHGTTVGIRPR